MLGLTPPGLTLLPLQLGAGVAAAGGSAPCSGGGGSPWRAALGTSRARPTHAPGLVWRCLARPEYLIGCGPPPLPGLVWELGHVIAPVRALINSGIPRLPSIATSQAITSTNEGPVRAWGCPDAACTHSQCAPKSSPFSEELLHRDSNYIAQLGEPRDSGCVEAGTARLQLEAGLVRKS